LKRIKILSHIIFVFTHLGSMLLKRHYMARHLMQIEPVLQKYRNGSTGMLIKKHLTITTFEIQSNPNIAPSSPSTLESLQT